MHNKGTVAMKAAFLILAIAVAQAAHGATPVAKTSDGFPKEMISIIVDSKAGSLTDVISRNLGEVMSKYAGVKVLVDNVEGGSGVMALNRMIGKKADGYTIFQQSSTLPITIAVGQAPFKMTDFVPLVGLLEDYCVATVNPEYEYKTLADVVGFAKDNPNKFNWGAAKVKGSMHLFTLKIAKAAGVKFNYIAYPSANDGKIGLMGGNILAYSSTVGNVREDHKEGRLKIVASALRERSPEFPDVPTFRELGYDSVSGYSVWRGLFVKPGIPKERMDKLAEILELTCKDPQWQEFLAKTIYSADMYLPQAEFAKYVDDFYAGILELANDM